MPGGAGHHSEHSVVVVVVVEVAERPLASNEEARRAVAQSFSYLRQRKRDRAHPIELDSCHATSLAHPSSGTRRCGLRVERSASGWCGHRSAVPDGSRS